MLERSFLYDLIRNPKLISKIKFIELSRILYQAKEIFKNENILLELSLNNPNEEAIIIGDIHGNLKSLKILIDIINKKKPKLVIFLGDLVDRGPHQLECLVIILALKILEPNRFYIIRGNHETLEMNQNYGFYYEIMQKFIEDSGSFEFGKFSEYDDDNIFSDILSVYLVLPYCVILNNIFFLVHGGIPEDKKILKKLKGLKPLELLDLTSNSIEKGIFQMMWNDPSEDSRGFIDNLRGGGIKYFGKEVFNKFMKANNLQFLIRSHECFPEGYRWFFNHRLLTIFSSSNYRGGFRPNPATYAIIKNNEIILKIL